MGSNAADQILGSSEMAVLIREFDWSKSPLGAIASWPSELVAATNLVLSWPTPMTLYWGPEFCLIYNEGYKRFLSDKHPSSLGAPASLVWQEMWSSVEPDFRKVADQGVPVVQRDIYLPALVNGETRDEWWTYTLAPLSQGGRIAGILNAAENRTQVVGVANDLATSQAEQKKAAGALAGSEQRLAIALETAALGLWQLDLTTMRLEGTATFKAAFGRKPDEPLSYAECLAALHADDLPALQIAVEHAMATGSAYRNEYRVCWPDGSEHWVLASGTMLPASDTAPATRVGVVLDVTERHHTTVALIQSEKLAAVGRLASAIAHEINNPLEAVTNLIFLAQAHAISPETRNYLETAEREMRRMSAVANKTLRFHKQATNRSPCSCVSLISDALMIYEARLINSKITVEKRKRAENPVVCFEGDVSQVISNLIGNAIDAMHGEGGRLILRSREGTDWRTGRRGLVITVADTGTGMSPKTVAHLFEAFYTTKGIGGTGLGLWISQGIMNNHHGRITFRTSQSAVHHGTVFNLFLPFGTAAGNLIERLHEDSSTSLQIA